MYSDDNFYLFGGLGADTVIAQLNVSNRVDKATKSNQPFAWFLVALFNSGFDQAMETSRNFE